MHLIVGPPASGKTSRLLEVAEGYLGRRKRVWWVGLPAQRAYVYRRATAHGAVLGLEFLTSQQLYYRLLAASLGLKPIVTGPGRVALAGEALVSDQAPVPSPGEARLFARAIAEAKRSGVSPAEVRPESPEARRLRQAYARYEEIKGNWGRWDYDDFRRAALDLLCGGQIRAEADLVVVDGFRELSALELRVLQALSASVPVWVGLPEAPPGFAPSQALEPRPAPAAQVYRAPNPVAEARWVMRSLKRDLALGASALDLAVIAPQARIPALLTLADEYGVPLIDQTPSTAAETPEGRLLLELLELPDYPTPSRLLAVPDLAPLGRAALERSLVGLGAITRLAHETGMAEAWESWLGRLQAPFERGSGDGGRGTGGTPSDGFFFPTPHTPHPTPALAWAAELLDALPEVRHSPRRAGLMERAREANRIASGPDFRRWWAALLSETYEPHRPPGGVALLTPTLASGRRWGKLYLTYAVEGAYGTGEREDYFVPEEGRAPLEEVMRDLGLARRFLGRDRALLEELRTRADLVVVTYPEASQEGPLEPEPALVPAATPPYLPKLPPGSLAEVARASRYQAGLSRVNLGTPHLEALRRHQECGLRHWAEGLSPAPRAQAWWAALVGELRKAEKLVPARLQAVCGQFPQAEGWLRHHAPHLAELSLGFRLEGQGLEARLDAVLRKGAEAHLYRFTEPDLHPDEAQQHVRSRWTERWAAAYLLGAFEGRIRRVSLWAWPVLGSPVLVYDKPIERVWGVLERLQAQAKAAQASFEAGVVEPRPGFHCRDCLVRDVCREGQSR